MITFPVLPPTFLSALPTPWAAFVIAGPADEETRERPSVAFDAADEADWLALEAASEVEEACLTVVLRVRNCDCRRTARDAATGILKATKEGKEGEKGEGDAEEVAGGEAAESNGGFREKRRATASEPELRFEFGKFRKRAPFT